MKKISAVLLVLVLVGSVAFAGFTGSATTTFGVDLDTGAYGFKNAKAIDIDIVLHEQVAGAKGEGAIYAEISASLAITFDSTAFLAAADNALDITTKISAAKIIGEDWYVSILGAMGAPNFASSAVDFDANDDPEDIVPGDFVAKNEGVEVGFKGYKFGVSVDKDLNNYKTGIYNVFV